MGERYQANNIKTRILSDSSSATGVVSEQPEGTSVNSIKQVGDCGNFAEAEFHALYGSRINGQEIRRIAGLDKPYDAPE
jgi:hypothetical protein